ncbi:MAG TPA: alpha-L-arabinofuranosidase C-terminal domain-containing protein, partial [Bryobacteraceae bacterium]|nr:alpha-L-arabinofuranosidase C-terminal domain-containing protein [Bryobacteraceae bacterium]
PSLLRTQTTPLQARVKIDPDRKIGAIDPKIYGNFAEHLGRCIEGGLFEEGSPLSDSQGYRKDVRQAVKDLDVTLLRWPGGNFASNYNWKDGIGPRDQRPARLEMAWGTVESNRFGTHEFLDYSESLGIEPYVCCNLGTGSWTDAQQWVEYCNIADGTAMSKLRKQNGREKPWGVKYWGLGYEMDGPWQMGHRSAEDYGKFALEAAKLMKWTDPKVQLIAAGSSNFRAGVDWVGWNREVLAYLKDHIEYLSLHMYVGNAANDYYDFLAVSSQLDDRIKTAAGVIRAALGGLRPQNPIYISFDEYNVWYRARGNSQRGRRILEERYNLEDALVIASMLNTFVNNADTVKIANMAQIVNVIAPIFTNEKGLFLQTIYHPLQLFAKNTRGTALQTWMDCPTYESKSFGKATYLDVSTSVNNGTVTINVVNRHLDKDIEVEIESQGAGFKGRFDVALVTGPDIKAENDFGKTTVQTQTSTLNAAGTKLKHRFPPHSYTMLKGQLA